MKSLKRISVLGLIGMVLVAGCVGVEDGLVSSRKGNVYFEKGDDMPPQDMSVDEPGEASEAPSVTRAIAVIQPTKGNSVSGWVKFEMVDGGVKVTADVAGLSPGKHGFHIHEFGDCSSPDGSSAGGHFNPGSMPHAAPGSMERHGGDLGNLEADAEGRARLEWIDPMITFDGSWSILGRAVIIHASEDDLQTQPTGNAGARIGCGVIGVAK